MIIEAATAAVASITLPQPAAVVHTDGRTRRRMPQQAPGMRSVCFVMHLSFLCFPSLV
jgi:hypothetical protein